MKFTKIAVIALVAYAGLVTAFESMIGILQPEAGSVLVITTVDSDGSPHDRVVARLESEGKLYVAVNHWPRAWYHRALENPEVRATIEGQTADYRAVPVAAEESERVNRAHPLGLGFRFLTGFPKRIILRLDPR
jgi:hypothetical protein